ncbi:MAG: COG4280 domain-containing protein [Cypionkella sp.]
MLSPSVVSTVTAAFLGSFVEVVEAFTIVLAVGVTRSWRPALTGAALALALLVVLVLIFGPLFALIPLQALQFVVGVLLLLFGMRWLRKAILRSAGFIPLHDEATAFAKETDILLRQAADKRVDHLAMLASFKAVLLEGVEVVFIVIAVGTAHGMTFYAGVGALAAVVLVLAIGVLVHKPLTQVPENTLKFAVGLMLTAFGIFWTGEGLGAHWPGGDAMLLGLLVVLGGVSALAVKLKRDTLVGVTK